MAAKEGQEVLFTSFFMHTKFQVLPRLSSLFSSLLAHDSWLIHQHALEAFAMFAEATNHEEVISQSLTLDSTKNKVVNFLSKVIADQGTAEEHVTRLKAEVNVIERHNDRLENKENITKDTFLAMEPCAKRARQETASEEEYERYLQTAESALRALQGIGGVNSSPPQWVTSRLKDLLTLITQLSCSTPDVS